MSPQATLNEAPDTLAVMRPVQLTQMAPIKVYEIMERDLLELESTSNEEKTSLGLLTFCAGVFVPLVGTWPAAGAEVSRAAVQYGVTATSGILAIFFAILFLIKRRRRASVVDSIRRLHGKVVDQAGQPGQSAQSTPTAAKP